MSEPEEKIYLVKVNRNHMIFKNRSYKFGKIIDGKIIINHKIPILDAHLLFVIFVIKR